MPAGNCKAGSAAQPPEIAPSAALAAPRVWWWRNRRRAEKSTARAGRSCVVAAARAPKKSSAALEGCLTHRSAFEGSSIRCDVPRLVAEPRWTLMKLVALQSVVSSEAASVSGCLLPAWRPCFQGVYWSHSTAGPRALASPGSSSHELYLSYRVSTAPDLPRTFVRDASLGVSIPIATSTERVHLRASIPSSPYGPPSAFLTPSVVCSSLCLAGLFHPAATSGIHLPGFFSRYPARATRRHPVPSCRLAAVACHRVAPTAPAPPAPSSGL